MAGFRRFEWDCEARGCFNVERRLNFGVFFDCLPKNLSFQDIDGTVEVNGHFLFLEWKTGGPAPLKKGQRLYAERLTKLSDRITYIAVCGEARTMSVTHLMVIKGGRIYDWRESSLGNLRERIDRWAEAASGGIAA